MKIGAIRLSDDLTFEDLDLVPDELSSVVDALARITQLIEAHEKDTKATALISPKPEPTLYDSEVYLRLCQSMKLDPLAPETPKLVRNLSAVKS